MISNAFGFEVKGRVARTLGLGGLGAIVRVLSKPPDQLAKVPQDAFSVLVVESRLIPRLVKCSAAAAEVEDHVHSKPLVPIIGLSTSYDAAVGGG